jgi:hypothetical protein
MILYHVGENHSVFVVISCQAQDLGGRAGAGASATAILSSRSLNTVVFDIRHVSWCTSHDHRQTHWYGLLVPSTLSHVSLLRSTTIWRQRIGQHSLGPQTTYGTITNLDPATSVRCACDAENIYDNVGNQRARFKSLAQVTVAVLHTESSACATSQKGRLHRLMPVELQHLVARPKVNFIG